MIKKIIKIVLIIVMIISLINIITWYIENTKTKNISNRAKKYIDIDNNIDSNIKEINKDIIGWLIVDNTNIDYPIVQTSNNDYYLNHNLDKEYSSAGWIFMDSRNSLDDQNLIIYGHHRRDGSMFGSIDNLLKNNKGGEIALIIDNKTINYSIFSIYKADTKYDYRETNYNNFDKKILEFKEKSLYNFDVDLNNKAQIITLSTCDNDNIKRIVVQAIKND